MATEKEGQYLYFWHTNTYNEETIITSKLLLTTKGKAI